MQMSDADFSCYFDVIFYVQIRQMVQKLTEKQWLI